MVEAVKNSVKHKLKMLGMVTLFTTLFFQAADAAYPPIYDVEIIVFQNSKNYSGGENLEASEIINLPGNGRAFPEGEFTELAYKFYQLKGISESLQESNDHKVLLHRAWRQLAYNSNDSVSYPLESMVNSDSKSIGGSVKLELEQDLTLDVDVLLMSSKIPSDPSSKRPIQQLMEKQQIKDDQIYYFNQPNLGIIAKVTPYQSKVVEKAVKVKNISFLRKLLAASAVAR